MDKDILIYKAKKILNENSSISAVGCANTFIEMDSNDFDHAAEEIAELCEEVQKQTAKDISDWISYRAKNGGYGAPIIKAMIKLSELIKQNFGVEVK